MAVLYGSRKDSNNNPTCAGIGTPSPVYHPSLVTEYVDVVCLVPLYPCAGTIHIGTKGRNKLLYARRVFLLRRTTDRNSYIGSAVVKVGV